MFSKSLLVLGYGLLVMSFGLWVINPVFAARTQGGNPDSFTIIQPPGAGITVPTGANQSGEGLVGMIMKNVVAIFFAVGGVGVVIYFLWGAVEWIFSGGDKEKISNARRRITHAIVGLVLLALSFIIINLVGRIVGFNPLGCLQIPGLQETNIPVVGQPC